MNRRAALIRTEIIDGVEYDFALPDWLAGYVGHADLDDLGDRTKWRFGFHTYTTRNAQVLILRHPQVGEMVRIPAINDTCTAADLGKALRALADRLDGLAATPTMSEP